jgi:hypothetical protein
MKIVHNNLVLSSNLTASSSDVNFPVSNLKHTFRNKVWRSSGQFIIDTTNNKIDFKESGSGSLLTATLTSGTYTSTTLKAEIKSKLESAGSVVYTVVFNNGIWNISSAGSYFSLLINTGTNTAVNICSKVLGFANTDRTGSLNYSGSNIAIHTEESVVIDTITTENINTVAILWDKFEGIKLSDTAVIKIQANATNNWTSPAVDQTLTINDTYEIATYHFVSDQSYRYWRLKIVDPVNVNLNVEVGVVILGKSLSVENADNGFKYQVNDESKVTSNNYGNEFMDILPQFSTLSFDYKVLDYDQIVLLENMYRTNGRVTPVIVFLDEFSTVFNKDHIVVYGKLSRPSTLNHMNYNLFTYDLQITELN